MAFRLAEAYTELRAKTTAHDTAIDKSVTKVKLYGVESQKVHQLSAKMFFALGAGAESAEALVGKLANTIRNLVSRLMEAAKAGTSFGDAIARWAHETLGMENAVSRLDARLKALGENPSAGALLDALTGRGAPRVVEGDLDPQTRASLTSVRDKLEGQLGDAMRGVSSAEAAAREAGLPPLFARDARFKSPNMAPELMAIVEADQKVQELNLTLKQLNDIIGEEIELRQVNRQAQEHQKVAMDHATAAARNFGAMFGGMIGSADFGGVARMLGRGARRNADEVADLVAQAERDINNADPAIFGRGRPLGDMKQSTAAIMGMEEFSRSILQSAAGQDPQLEIMKQQKEHTRRIDENIQKIWELRTKGPAGAVFAEGAIA